MTLKRRSQDATKPAPKPGTTKPSATEIPADREIIDGMVFFGLRPRCRKAA